MSAQRSAQPEVRNPVLGLAATQQLLELPPESRAALAAVLEELATQAHAKAEVSWRQRKGPMAAYWRAVGVYARHTARATRRGTGAGWPADGRVLVDVQANGTRLQLRELEPINAGERAELERLRYVHGGDRHVCGTWRCHA